MPHEVTQLLIECGKGNEAAFDQLMPLVYAELRLMARRYMRMQDPGHTLQATALIHEAYLRLIGDSDKQWTNRAHFFGVAAKSMRHILVDHARAHRTAKRGGPHSAMPLDEAAVVSGGRRDEILALDDALTDLERLNARQSRVVDLRYFGGLSVEETAEVLHISAETVKRDWRAAKAWLHKELADKRAAGVSASDT